MDPPFHSSCQVSTSAKLLVPCVRRFNEKGEKFDEKGEKLNVRKKRRRLLDENGEKLTVQRKRRRRLDGKGEKLNVRKKGRRITLSSFPDELLQEILCKLPVRDLTQGKCVCKLWGGLISSKEFISLHLKKYETSVILVKTLSRSERVRGGHGSITPVYPPSTPPNAISMVDFTLPAGFPNMTGACNGIICLWDTEKPDHIALWNPANKDLKIIPESKLPRQSKYKRCRVFFGYDEVRNDYKIMRVLIGDVGCRCLEFELYSLSSGVWKKLDFSDMIREPNECFAHVIHSTGGKIVSWFVSRDNKTRVGRRWEVVLFDMCSERYEIVEVPVEASMHECLGLRPYEASIGVMDAYLREQVWVLKDINSPPSGGLRSWEKVDLPKIPRTTFLRVVGFWDEHLLFRDDTLRLIMFDLARLSCEDVGFCRYRHVEAGTRYKESLVRLL